MNKAFVYGAQVAQFCSNAFYTGTKYIICEFIGADAPTLLRYWARRRRRREKNSLCLMAEVHILCRNFNVIRPASGSCFELLYFVLGIYLH